MECFLDLHSSGGTVSNSGSSKDRTESVENPSANGQNHHHHDVNNRDVGETVSGLCKPSTCTFHRVLHDLGYHVIKYRVKRFAALEATSAIGVVLPGRHKQL